MKPLDLWNDDEEIVYRCQSSAEIGFKLFCFFFFFHKNYIYGELRHEKSKNLKRKKKSIHIFFFLHHIVVGIALVFGFRFKRGKNDTQYYNRRVARYNWTIYAWPLVEIMTNQPNSSRVSATTVKQCEQSNRSLVKPSRRRRRIFRKTDLTTPPHTRPPHVSLLRTTRSPVKRGQKRIRGSSAVSIPAAHTVINIYTHTRVRAYTCNSLPGNSTK